MFLELDGSNNDPVSATVPYVHEFFTGWVVGHRGCWIAMPFHCTGQTSSSTHTCLVVLMLRCSTSLWPQDTSFSSALKHNMK